MQVGDFPGGDAQALPHGHGFPAIPAAKGVVAGRIRQREAIEDIPPSGKLRPVRLLRENSEVEGGADSL